MYKIVAHFSGLRGPYFDQKHHFSNAGGHEVRYTPNKALIFRMIRYLTEHVSDRSGKNKPIAKITDPRSDTATAMLQLVPACGLEATANFRSTASPAQPIPRQSGLVPRPADVGLGPWRGLVPRPADVGLGPRRGLVPRPTDAGWVHGGAWFRSRVAWDQVSRPSLVPRAAPP